MATKVPTFDCKQMPDGRWHILFKGQDTDRSFEHQVEGLGWLYQNLLMLQTDSMMFGENFMDAKTGERIDPLTVKEIGQ